MNRTMSAHTSIAWRKSSRSANNGSCVEAGVWRRSTKTADTGNCVEASFQPPHIATRDSKHLEGGMLIVSRDEWQGFLASLRS